MPNLMDTNSLEQSVSAAKEYVDNRVNSLDDIAILIKGDKGEQGPKGDPGPPTMLPPTGSTTISIYIDESGTPRPTLEADTSNIAIGYEALIQASGKRNIAIGHRSLRSNLEAVANVVIGFEACANSNGNGNTAIGHSSMFKTTSGRYNTAVGCDSFYDNITGQYNVAIGYRALVGVSSNENTAIGVSALENNTSVNKSTGIGSYAQVTGSNQVQLGASGTTTYAYGAVQNRSDERDKANIGDLDYNYHDFIMGLKARLFQWDYREDYRDRSDPENPDMRKLGEILHDGTHIRSRRHGGFIAQEVKALADSLGFDFSGYQDHSINGGDDVLSLGYEAFIPPMVATIQDQDREIKDLKLRLEQLETLVEQLVNK